MDPFVGEIRIFPLDWAPPGWALCDGSTLQVNQNAALYSLIGNNYGGTANVNFKLPDLRGRTAVQFGNKLDVGAQGGTETVALTASQVPQHNHTVNVVNANGKNSGAKDHHIAAAVVPGATPIPTPLYNNARVGNLVALNPATVSPAGSGAGHTNVQPYLVLGYFIATAGIYPTRP